MTSACLLPGSLFDEEPLDVASVRDAGLCQWFTPEWAAARLVELYFPGLSGSDLVLEPSCGDGAFLKAIPANVPVIGVEIDPVVARRAEANTERPVILGDFCSVALPDGVTAIIGNPPFEMDLVDRILARAHRLLPDHGRAGFVLPAYAFQTFSRVIRWGDRWSLKADFIPRNLFPGIRMPLVFATFDKERERKMIGFALYREAAEVNALSGPAREVLTSGRPRQGVWKALLTETLAALGGRASLSDIYNYIEPRRPTANSWWREQVRKVLQKDFVRCGDAVWATE